MRIPSGAWTATLLLCSCASCDTVPSQALTACESVGIASAKTDILFVVDDSGSMAQEQANLATNFQAFVGRLVMLPIKNDFQIGITTTSVHQYSAGTYVTTFPATSGSCNPVPNAGQPYPQGTIISVTGPDDPTQRLQSTTAPPRILAGSSPTLGRDFTQNVFVGICGSGKEQGLEAARLAVSEPLASGGNSGFLRPGARLAVIVVSDDDDCSDPLMQGNNNEPPGCTSYDVQAYIDFFKGPIGGSTRNVVVGAITGVDPSTIQPAVCNGPGGTPEHAAVRYKAFVDAFGPMGIVDSICEASFASTLERIATLIGQEVPLALVPADWHLLTVTLTRTTGEVVSCGVAPSDPAACRLGFTGDAGADVVYAPPSGTDRQATLTFQGRFTIGPGDSIEVKVLCAR
jgi:hypothetical protein